MRNAKLGAQKYVGRRRCISASPSGETDHDATNPSVVIGSSNSGSRTPPRASRTSVLVMLYLLGRAAARLYRPSSDEAAQARPGVQTPHGAPHRSCRLDQLGVVPRAGLGDLQLLRHLDVVELGRVEAEDLLLRGRGDPRVVGELVARVVPVDEALDLPLGLPNAVVGAEGHL